MICETGRVVGIDDDALWVETVSRSTCGSCVAQNACGQGVLNRHFSGRRNQLRVKLGDRSADEFSLNDEVDISIPEVALVGGAMVVYLLPLVTMLMAAVLADRWWNSDGVAAVGALAGFVLGMALVRGHGVWASRRASFQPQIVARRGFASPPPLVQPLDPDGRA